MPLVGLLPPTDGRVQGTVRGAGRRTDEAVATFERLLALRNDVGLLAEEWDVEHGRQVGSFPQAFSHVSLLNTARNLSEHGGPAERRCEEENP